MGSNLLVSEKIIKNKVFTIRGKRVMLDRDLAKLYGVETRVLNQAVRRNLERFPEEFMFQLTKIEMEEWKSQIVTSNREKMGLRKRPYVFSEAGVAMLSSVLNSKKAIQVNIEIIKVFIKLRELMVSNKEIVLKVSSLEQSVRKNDKDIKVIFNAMNQLMSPKKQTVLTLTKTNLKVVNREIQEALHDLNRKPKPDITGSMQHATAAVECVLRNITGEHNATLGQILKKRKDIIPPPLNVSVEKAWGYASDRARHVREGDVLDYSEAEFVVTQFISVANFLVRKFKS